MQSQLSSAEEPTAQVAVTDVSFEHVRERHVVGARGIGTPRPRLSWIIQARAANWQQSAYEIEAYRPDGELAARIGRVESGDSVLISWPFAPLASREQLLVRVRVWGVDGQPSSWSELGPGRGGPAEPERLDCEVCDARIGTKTRASRSRVHCSAANSTFAQG